MRKDSSTVVVTTKTTIIRVDRNDDDTTTSWPCMRNAVGLATTVDVDGSPTDGTSLQKECHIPVDPRSLSRDGLLLQYGWRIHLVRHPPTTLPLPPTRKITPSPSTGHCILKINCNEVSLQGAAHRVQCTELHASTFHSICIFQFQNWAVYNKKDLQCSESATSR
jgi:hypothetical protein